jgi:hypothetical protein
VRAIRLESDAEAQLQKLKVDYARFDDLMVQFVENVLCTHPETFPAIPGTLLRVCFTNEFGDITFPDLPSLALYFHFDDQCVYIVAIDRNEQSPYGL